MNRFLYTIITCSALLHLSSCSSGGDQDRAQASQEHKPWNGVAIDGHIARAKIYVDSNNNGTQDPWEPYAFTDDHGYYGYNPNTGTDYCRSDATEHEKTFCLRASVTQGKVTLRITGGYDRLTGEPFIGQLSRRVDATNLSDTQSTVISPITSLVTALDDPATQNALLTSLGLEHKDLNIDYLNAGSSQSVDAFLLNTALKIHKTITLLNGPSESHYAALNDEPGIANDATSFLYQALATELSERKIPLDIALRDNELIDAIALNAEATLRDILDKNDLILPRSIEQSDNRDRFESAKRHTQAIPDVIDRLLNVGDISMDRGQIIGQVRAVEMLIIKALAANPDDASVQNAFQFFLNTDNANHIEALRLALSDDTADISNLAKNNFIDIGAILASAQIQNNTGAFKNITQSKIRVMDMDLGIAPHQLKDIELELYFSASSQPNASATQGQLVACAKYIEDASLSALGEGNFKGERINGYWSLLGASESNPSSYSLLLNFNFLGTQYQAIMKPAGSTTLAGETYQQLRFDFNGDIRVWHSQQGFTEIGTLPRSNQDCLERLPSRIGL